MGSYQTKGRQAAQPQRRPTVPVAARTAAAQPTSAQLLQRRLGNQGTAAYISRSAARVSSLPNPAERGAAAKAAVVMPTSSPSTDILSSGSSGAQREGAGSEPASHDVSQEIHTSTVQAKLTISHPNDPYEQEADRVADQVMRMTAPESVLTAPSRTTVQRVCNNCEEEISTREQTDQPVVVGDATHVHRSASSTEASQVSAPVAASIHSMQGGGGSALPAATRAFFEPRFGADFSHVRVHTGSHADSTAKAISAKAFTVGSDIVFAGGQYSPESHEGQRLLAHELTHVMQQRPSELRRDVQRMNGSAVSQTIPPAQQIQSKSAAVTVQRDLLNDIGDEISEKARSMVGAVSNVASDIADTASGVFDGVKEHLQQTLDAGLGQITNTWAVVKHGATTAVSGAIQQATGLLSGIGTLFGGVGMALKSLNVDSLRAVWSSITSTANAALTDVRGLAVRVTATVDGLWWGLKQLANRVIGGLQTLANGLIGRLPSAVQGLARSLWSKIEGRLRNALRTIESEWLSMRESVIKRVNRLVTMIAAIVGSLKNSVIRVIIDTLDRLRRLFTFLKEVMANPNILIDPVVKDIIGRLQPLPDKSKAYVQTKVRENVAGGPSTTAASSMNRVIQRAAAPADHLRSTLGVAEVISGCWDFLTDKIGALWAKLGSTIKEMVLSLICPPATWKALKNDWTEMTNELSMRVDRFENIRTDSLDQFDKDLSRYLSNLADFPLIVWRAANAMLGHLSVYIGLAMVVGGAIAGAIAVGTGGAVFGSVVPAAGTAAGGGLGIGAGLLAGAAAGYAAAETVGLIFLLSFMVAEQLSIFKAINDLLWVPQSEEEQKEDFSQTADSTIAIVTALLLMGIAFIGVAFAKRVWTLVKSIPGRLRPNLKIEPKASEPKSAEPAKVPKPGSRDALVICRACDVVPGVPKDLMAQRAALSPEMRAFLDAEAAKIFPDPANPKAENFKALRDFMDDAAKKGGLENGLREKVAARDVGKVTVPIDFDGHITRLELKANGDVVGGHSTATGEVKIVPGSKGPANAQGVYEAKVQMADPANPGSFKVKTTNGGRSTMFPDSWTPNRIKVEVDAAFQTKTISGNTWTGTTPSGVNVRGFLSPKVTVYPLL